MTYARAAILAILVVIAAVSATRAHAQPSPAQAEAHERRCREVALAFMTAMDAGDRGQLTQTIFFSDRGGVVLGDRGLSVQERGLEAFVECVVAQRDYEAAVAERFGPAAAAPIVAQSRFTEADYAALRNARFELRGGGAEEAVLILAPSVAPIYLQRRQNIGWRVVLRSVSTLYANPSRRNPDRPEPGSQRRIDDMKAAAKTVADAAGQVRAGAFATPAAAAAALQTALEKAAATGS